MTNTTTTASTRHYAVYSPRGFANEVTVEEYETAAAAKSKDGGFNAKTRAAYIRRYKRVALLGERSSDTFDEWRSDDRLAGVRGWNTFTDY